MAQRRHTPTVRLRRLAGELRRLRGQAGLSWEYVAEATTINKSTLYRIESAKTRPQRRTLLTLLNLYGADEELRDHLVALLKDSAVQGWLRPYHSDLRDEYTAFISFESEARGVRTYQSLFMPGLLQTEDYARAVVRGTLPAAADAEVEDRVRARIERQELLATLKPFWAVVDEGALRRVVGGDEVMRDQLARLIEVGKWPNVTLQVIPYSAGAHPGMTGQFILLDFADPMDTDLIYIDSMAGDLFLESDAEVLRYRSMFDHLVAMALSPKDSTILIADIMGGSAR